ncbi:WD repeat-containing protein 89 [Nilaparvata lugens]|uniref:WD repeat-containing protein 89 n=1 Tax=Nilaparvata lugens TaxID=108931 RepID=UPI00193CB991|nr:WD repeat-containing protein 89 [Nilaparvata lugens]
MKDYLSNSENIAGMSTNMDNNLSDNSFSLPQYSIQGEEVVKQNNYVLNITGFASNSDTKIACSTSDNTISIYNLNESWNKLSDTKVEEDRITSLRFIPQRNNQLCYSSTNGSIQQLDLRVGCNQVKKFKDTSNKGNEDKPILSFDISCDGRFICAGTEVAGGDAFLLFWDVRSTKLLGGYWESHTEDITQVVFHPSKPHHLLTGAMDGLMNVLDVSQPCEDDALLTSLNTESSVERLSWIEEASGDEIISCLTHPNDLQMWRESDSKPFAQFSREQIASAVNLKCADSLYTVDVHKHQPTNNLMLLTGSYTGDSDWFRSAVVREDSLGSVSQFIGNSQIVRASWYDSKNDLLVTGGEKGIVTAWKPQDNLPKSNSISTNVVNKKDSKLKGTRMKPY